MLRITPRPKRRISNRLAIFAGLLLVISALAGMNQSSQWGDDASGQLAGIESTVPEISVNEHPGVKNLRKSKGFKGSLFLFRID